MINKRRVYPDLAFIEQLADHAFHWPVFNPSLPPILILIKAVRPIVLR
jgi:hypothetical protein